MYPPLDYEELGTASAFDRAVRCGPERLIELVNSTLLT